LGASSIWVFLPGLPLHFLSEDIFIHIDNELGTYLDHDFSYTTSNNKSMARVLVHLHTREGLEENITLH